MTRIVWFVTSDSSMRNSKNSSGGASIQWKRMNFSISNSVTSALSVVPFQEKLKTLSRSSTLSANHSCKPAGVLKNSYKIEGEHLTGYSTVNNVFLLIAFVSRPASFNCFVVMGKI